MAKEISSIVYTFIYIQLVVSISGESCDLPTEFERSRPCEREEPPFPLGKSVKYCCDAGFKFSGNNRFATCMLDEDSGNTHWDTPDLQCQPVSCSPPDRIANGRVIGSRYTFPNSVKYECHKGYKLHGVNQRYCETNGEWSGRIPKCQIVTCPQPDVLANGAIVFSSTEYSSIATHKCSPGYRLEGNDKRRCTHEGIWDGEIPKCAEVLCPEPKDPINGKVTLLNGGRRKDSHISYSCIDGTTLVGESFATCMENGEWSTEIPICGRPCTVPKLGRGKMGREEPGWQRNKWKFVEKRPSSRIDSGETLLLRCQSNYELPVEELFHGDVVVVCDDGTLTPNPACHPAWCRNPLPDNGKGRPPLPPYNMESGSVIEYEDSCLNIGKTLQKKKASCFFGKWTVTEAKCEDLRCKGTDLEALSIDASSKELYDDGEIIEVKCKDKYEQSSDARRIRCVNGQWQIKNSPCKPASCIYPPPAVDGAQASISSGEHGTVVNYRCFPPYQLVSREQPISCSYGQWRGEVPSCKDTRCHTSRLIGYEGVKQENKTISDNSVYTPKCMDGYDSSEVQLQCHKGNFGSEKPFTKFCEPGNCIVPYIAHGEFYIWKIDKGFFSTSKYLERVDENSIANHNTEFVFVCTDGRKFQGKFDNSEKGTKVTCNKKKWDPKPECWFFPQRTTNAPSTTDRPIENQSDINDAKFQTPDYDTDNVSISNNLSHRVDEIVPNVSIQNYSRDCEFNNSDAYLLIFIDDQVKYTGTIPQGSSIEFGCQPIGTRRLDGPDSANCTEGEWEPKNFPTCVAPTEGTSVVITFHSRNGYETYPKDVVKVPKHSIISVVCYELSQRSRPNLVSLNRNRSIFSLDGFDRRYGIVFSYIKIWNFTDEDSGSFFCRSATDQHMITVLVKEDVGPREIVCPQLNSTDHLSITYDTTQRDILPYTKAFFFCREAKWELRGRESITCLESGKWSSEPPICVKTTERCWPLPEITNGNKVGDSLEVGSVVIYNCKRGFSLVGSREITCKENTRWSNDVPWCSEIRCPVPTKISNSEVHFLSLKFDSEIEYRCHSGYKLAGNSKLRCMDNGKWSGDPPICEEESAGCSSHHLLDILPEGAFGKNITGENMPEGSVVELVCDGISQVLLGSKYAICSSKGFWRVGDVECVPGCNAIEKPSNSSLVIENIKEIYRFGDSLTFSCPENEKLSIDVELVVCLGTGWSEESVPTCIPLKA